MKNKNIGLMLVALLPEITNAQTNNTNRSFLIIGTIMTCIIAVIISYYIWYSYGKDKKVTKKEATDYKMKLDPLELAVLYNEEAKRQDICTTLLYLATKGYIKIKEKKRSFSIVRGKEYQEKNKYLKEMLSILFKKEETDTLTKEVLESDLKAKINKMEEEILPQINEGKIKKKYYDEEAEQKKSILVVIMSFILVLVTCIPFLETNKLIYIPLSLILSIFTLSVLIEVVDKMNMIEWRIRDILLLALVFIAVWLVFLLPIFSINRWYILTYMMGVGSVSIILYLYKFMSKKTNKAVKYLNEIESIKEYATKNNVEVENNKTYLYEILPFAYTLGINDIIYKRMKVYGCKKPAWWSFDEDFTVLKFKNSIERFLVFIATK